jgi:adsorption protein B
MVHKVFVVLNIIVAVGFLVSGIDDLFIDLFFWIRELYRKVVLRRRIRPITEKDLASIPEKWAAVWIPAWHEHEVIDKMLLNTLESLAYRNYDIFVGTYPNDEATQLAVESVRERYRQVRKVVCPKPGPTNKADCLNWVFQGMLLAEQERGIRYEIVVMHDSEDIIHPLELKFFNWLIPRKDMVQIPVIPLEMPARYWTAGTYLDEFAENHWKDLLVRERLSTVIPSAGVGTGLSRALLDDLARTRHNQLFNINSLTEDYEFGFGLLPLNRRSILARYAVDRTQTVTRGLWRKRQEFRQVREPVAVRELFPDTFRLAVRQKSRWVLGISIQGWRNLGWQGGFWSRYMLYRDRKSLATNPLNALGYLVLGYWLVNILTHPWGQAPSLVQSEWVWTVILADTGLMLQRLVERVVAVYRVGSLKQAFLSIPRVVVGNAVNFCATAVAIKQFCHAKRTGQRVAWQKTAHAFPSAKQLREHRRRLGDLLLENRLVSVAQLREALDNQQQSGQRLGEVLTRLGYVSEEDLLAVIGKQLGVPTFNIDHRTVAPLWLKKLPREMAEKLLALPIRLSNGELEVVCANPATPGLKKQLEELLGCPVRLGLASDNDVRFAISRAYLSLEGRSGLMLGELLVSAGAVTHAQLQSALHLQQQTGRRLGEVLQDQGVITAQILAAALCGQQTASAELKG